MRMSRIFAAGAAVVLSLILSRLSPADDWSEPLLKLKPQVRAQARNLRERMAAERESRDGVLTSEPSFAGRFDSSVPFDTQSEMLRDLAFVRSIRGSGASGLHQEIFGEVDGPVYLDFFGSRVESIGLDAMKTGPGVMAYVSPLRGHSKVWLTRNYVGYSIPTIGKVEILFHESRHTEIRNRFWPHATCPKPFLDENGRDVRGMITGTPMAGEPACDRTPFGSYGSSMIMIKNIQKFCSNCTEKVKMDAGLYADDTLRRIIDPAAKKAIKDDLYR